MGVAGGEYGIRGFIAAFDAQSGREAWRFYTIPAPGEPGHETWGAGDAWQHGGASVWVTGSYDAVLGLTYWGIGNPGPDWNPKQRPGDNLYSDSVVALDPDTGELKWHFQFTPNDDYDYDAVQVPVLADIPPPTATAASSCSGATATVSSTCSIGRPEFVRGAPFVKVNWASGLDERGRPIETRNLRSRHVSRRAGRHELVLAVVQPEHAAVLSLRLGELRLRVPLRGRRVQTRRHVRRRLARQPIAGCESARTEARPDQLLTDALGNGAVIAIDPKTGSSAGASRPPTSRAAASSPPPPTSVHGLARSYFYALDARTGAQLWRASLGGQGANGPMSYAVNGAIRRRRIGQRAVRVRFALTQLKVRPLTGPDLRPQTRAGVNASCSSFSRVRFVEPRPCGAYPSRSPRFVGARGVVGRSSAVSAARRRGGTGQAGCGMSASKQVVARARCAGAPSRPACGWPKSGCNA